MAQELGRNMDHEFHLGEGRLVFKAAAADAGIHIKRGSLPNITRSSVGAKTEPGRLLDALPAYALGFHAKESRRVEESRGGAHRLASLGRNAFSVSTAAFSALFRDAMAVQAAWQLAAQTPLEPWALEARRRKRIALESTQVAHASFWAREALRIMLLLEPRLPTTSMRALCRPMFYAKPASFFLPWHEAVLVVDARIVKRRTEDRVTHTELQKTMGASFGKALPTFWSAVADLLYSESGAPTSRRLALQVRARTY